jgi:hypothetical protein
VEQFLQMVSSGEDPMAVQREASLATHFHLLDGCAGERIADHLVNALRYELGLPKQAEITVEQKLAG